MNGIQKNKDRLKGQAVYWDSETSPNSKGLATRGLKIGLIDWSYIINFRHQEIIY